MLDLKHYWCEFRRIWFDIGVLGSIFLLVLFAPDTLMPVEAKEGLLAIFITKFILISAGITHAHISRKLLWKYIKFKDETDLTNNLMIIAWYVTVIFCWARGG